MNTHTFCLRNYDLLGVYELDDACCVYSCSIIKHDGYHFYRVSTNLFTIIEEIKYYINIFERLMLKDDIHIYCMNAFWRKAYNKLYHYNQSWVKKEIILSKSTLRIKNVITYYEEEIENIYHKFRDSFHTDRVKYEPAKFEIIDLKYRDKLITTENAVYITEDGKPYTSFEEALYNATHIQDYKDSIERFISIDIYDPTVSNMMPIEEGKDYSLDEVKEMFSKNISHRYVTVDPDKTKILCESAYASGFECGFDYGILYGHIILDQFREYYSASGFNIHDERNMICECFVTPYKRECYDSIDRLIAGKDRYDLIHICNDFYVAENFFEAKEDYYYAIDSMPAIYPVEDMIPVYDYSKYNRVRVHFKAEEWKENKEYQSFTALGKANGKDHIHDYLYGQTIFVEELVDVNDFLAFITFDNLEEEYKNCDVPLLEVKYDYMKVINDNGNLTALVDIDASDCTKIEEDRDLIIMIPKKKEEA